MPGCITCTSKTRRIFETTFPASAVDAPHTANSPAPTQPEIRSILVVGTGLIGGSIAAAATGLGVDVTVADSDAERAAEAVQRGYASASAPMTIGDTLHLGTIDAPVDLSAIDLVVVATPARSVAGLAQQLLESGARSVTDVGSVKAEIVDRVNDPRFVGGHPMAGSEQLGLDGVRADMFQGAVWVLTPHPAADQRSLATVHRLVQMLGAEPLLLDPEAHDEMVAMVSHVPHLTAVTLMGIAAERSTSQAALLRLAAGGFRDMTRIAGGHPAIWPDICVQNRPAIVDALDELIQQLGSIRDAVERSDEPELLQRLELARAARVNLPGTAGSPVGYVEVRVPLLDRPGELATLTADATEVGANIYDIEIAHSAEGDRGVAIVVVSARHAPAVVQRLRDRGYQATHQELT